MPFSLFALKPYYKAILHCLEQMRLDHERERERDLKATKNGRGTAKQTILRVNTNN